MISSAQLQVVVDIGNRTHYVAIATHSGSVLESRPEPNRLLNALLRIIYNFNNHFMKHLG